MFKHEMASFSLSSYTIDWDYKKKWETKGKEQARNKEAKYRNNNIMVMFVLRTFPNWEERRKTNHKKQVK